LLILFLLLAEKLAKGAENDAAGKDGEELDQVAGNAEDEIGERIAAVRETELLYGPDSLLALYGPLLVRICGRPDQFKVRRLGSGRVSVHATLTPLSRTRRCEQ
jgi:condensin complex subunit 1